MLLKESVIDDIEMFYNLKRRHAYLGYLSPIIFEETWILEKST